MNQQKPILSLIYIPSLNIGVSYSSLCKFLRESSLDKTGKFKKPIKYNEAVEEFFGNFVLKNWNQISDIERDFGTTPGQIQNLMKEYKLKKEWAFADSSSENIAIGRKGELFIKNQEEFIVVADKIKTNSKSDYDLILREYGSVDSKVTKLRKTESGSHRHKFNVANVTSNTKFVFCIGYTEDYEEVMILLKFPYKFVKGKQSLSVPVETLMTSKYKSFIHKIYASSKSFLYGEDFKDGFIQEDNIELFQIIENNKKKFKLEVYAKLMNQFEDGKYKELKEELKVLNLL